MNTLAFIAGMPGGSEVLLILFIILLLFGAKRLPELSRALGKSLGEFKKGKADLEREIRNTKNEVHEQLTTPEPDPQEKVRPPASDDASGAPEP